MRTILFLKRAIMTMPFVAASLSIHAAAQPEDLSISNAPGIGAASVFIGDDKNMPVGEGFRFSMNPSINAQGAILVPESVRAAILELKDALPNWFLNALIRGRGERECDVMLDEGENREISLVYYLTSWIWVNWHLSDLRSPLRQELTSMMIREEFMSSSLVNGLCMFLRTTDLDVAVSEVSRHSLIP